MRNLFEKLVPFIFLGVMIALLWIGLVISAYLLVFGAIVMGILFVIAKVKSLFPSKKPPATPHQGRTIEHEK